jgi:hypothetical protein
MTTRTIRDLGGPRAHWGQWRKLGVLGLALVLPGGLVLLLLLIARARTRAASMVGDPYVDWLRMRERLRSDRPASGTRGLGPSDELRLGRDLPPSRLLHLGDAPARPGS